MKHKELMIKEDNTCESCIEIEAENAQLKEEIIELRDANAHLLDRIRSYESKSLKRTKMESIQMKFKYALWNYRHGM